MPFRTQPRGGPVLRECLYLGFPHTVIPAEIQTCVNARPYCGRSTNDWMATHHFGIESRAGILNPILTASACLMRHNKRRINKNHATDTVCMRSLSADQSQQLYRGFVWMGSLSRHRLPEHRLPREVRVLVLNDVQGGHWKHGHFWNAPQTGTSREIENGKNRICICINETRFKTIRTWDTLNSSYMRVANSLTYERSRANILTMFSVFSSGIINNFSCFKQNVSKFVFKFESNCQLMS